MFQICWHTALRNFSSRSQIIFVSKDMARTWPRPWTFSKLRKRLIVRPAWFLFFSEPWPSELVFQGLRLRVTSPHCLYNWASCLGSHLLHDQIFPGLCQSCQVWTLLLSLKPRHQNWTPALWCQTCLPDFLDLYFLPDNSPSFFPGPVLCLLRICPWLFTPLTLLLLTFLDRQW